MSSTIISPAQRRERIVTYLHEHGPQTGSQLWDNLRHECYAVHLPAPAGPKFVLAIDSDLRKLERDGRIRGVTASGVRRKGETITWTLLDTGRKV